MELYGTHVGEGGSATLASERLLEATQREGRFPHGDLVGQLEVYGRRQKEEVLWGFLAGLVPALALPVGLAVQWAVFAAGAYCLVTGLVLHQVRDASSSELRRLLDVKYMLMTLGALLMAVQGAPLGALLMAVQGAPLDLLKNLTLYLVFVRLCSVRSLRSIYLGSSQ